MNNHFASAEMLRDLFDHAHDLIQIVNIDGTILYVNRSWSKLLGYEQDEIIGTSIYRFIEESDCIRYSNYREQVIMQQISGHPIVISLVSKSGQSHTIEGIVSVKVENDQALYTRGIFRDISERLRSEAELQKLTDILIEREFNLQQLLTYAPDAIIVIDDQSRITYWNPKAEEMFGWKSQEVINASLAEIIIPMQYRAAHEAGMKRHLATGEKRVLNRTIEITALKKFNQEFFISLTISKTTQKGNTAFVSFIRDITERKEAEKDINNKTRQLELSNRSLEAFAYAASHDLKQPIRKIQIFTEQLSRAANEKLSEAEKNYLVKIERASVRMRDLIEDLLTYSSLPNDLSFSSEVNLNHVLRDVIEDLEVEISEHHATIRADELPIVNGSRRQLQQLFHNLIGNSIKYSKGTNPSVTVRAVRVTGKNSSFELPAIEDHKWFNLIEVIDDGIGFNQQHAGRIFDIFTRLHDQNKYQGSGVGLSIALMVIENHHGFIKAEGQEGVGATFKILLPEKVKES